MRVRVGSKYVFTPVFFDVSNPPFGVDPGDTVTVVNLPGAPKANTMGMAHVAKDGVFAGMVMTNSLVPVGKEVVMSDALAAMLPCPLCASTLEYHPDGVVEVPMLSGARVATLAPFLACTGCEWCETVDNLLLKLKAHKES